GRELDRRRTLRSAMRTEGHPLDRAWRDRRIVDRRLIFLIDVSGSMEPYARPVVVFAQLVREAARRVEVYTFGTRLTRITGELSGRSAARALERAGRAIPDWAGGTRIGESVKRFNDTAGARGLSRGAVVVVVSDGCERGAADVLGHELARLRRAAHAIVWVNPLAGDARYEPRTQGMVAALPHVDVLLAGHSVAALEALAVALEAIPEHRSSRAGGYRV
ncbi:MAG TPA: VWA domain-containing protein, partial [Solirubrobacteraceae bacterium]